MNARRRKTLNCVLDQIDELTNLSTSDAAIKILTECSDKVELCADEEECCYDMLPENFQYSSRGDYFMDNYDSLLLAKDSLDIVIANIETTKTFNYQSNKTEIVKAVTKIKEAINR